MTTFSFQMIFLFKCIRSWSVLFLCLEQQLVFKFKLHLKNVKSQDGVSKREILSECEVYVLLYSIRTSFLSFHKIISWFFLFCFVFFNLARSTIYLEAQTPPREEIEIYWSWILICWNLPVLSRSVHRPSFTQVNVILSVHSSCFPSLLCPFLLSSPQDEHCRLQHNPATLLSAPHNIHYCIFPHLQCYRIFSVE